MMEGTTVGDLEADSPMKVIMKHGMGFGVEMCKGGRTYTTTCHKLRSARHMLEVAGKARECVDSSRSVSCGA